MITNESQRLAKEMLRDLNPEFVNGEAIRVETINSWFNMLSTGEQVVVGVCQSVLQFPIYEPVEPPTVGDVVGKLDRHWMARVSELVASCVTVQA
jgi:hypothetical protein